MRGILLGYQVKIAIAVALIANALQKTTFHGTSIFKPVVLLKWSCFLRSQRHVKSPVPLQEQLPIPWLSKVNFIVM